MNASKFTMGAFRSLCVLTAIACLNHAIESCAPNPFHNDNATDSIHPVMSSTANQQKQENKKPMDQPAMSLGNFSVSLVVKDLIASKAFYEKLDFRLVGGKLEQRYVVMQNGTTTIGLYQGMFEKNMLTFNPGWNHKKETLDKFQNVRELQAIFKERGIKPVKEADVSSGGPAHFVIVDPDGNSILFDQHVSKRK